MPDRLERLRRLLQKNAIIQATDKPFTLAAGGKSWYYCDVKRVSLLPEGASLIAEVGLEVLRPLAVQAVGGLAAGSVPISEAITLRSLDQGHPIQSFYVRDNGPKSHGTGADFYASFELLEAPEPVRVAIVDDVLTSGNSIGRAIQAVKKRGWEIVVILVLVDRDEGGAASLRDQGYRVEALFTSDKRGTLRPSVLVPA